MKSAVYVLPVVLPLAFAGCVTLDPTTKPQTIERGVQAAEQQPCKLGDYKVYRPTPGDRGPRGADVETAPYDAVIPPTYDVPSQVRSYCSDKLGK